MANITLDFLHNYHTGERRESDPAYAYQYDEGHVLEAVLPSVVTTVELHYWIRGMEEAEAYTPTSITPNDDNSCTILGNIPNKYFETNGELRIYIVVNDASASITTYEGKLNICQRSKPDDYVDDDPENEATRVLNEAREAAATATAAAQTAQDAADSIPADYSQMSEDVSQLKEEFINFTSKNLLPINSSWTKAALNANGTLNTNATWRLTTTDIFYCETDAIVSLADGFSAQMARYSSDGTFIERRSISNGYSFDPGTYLRVSVYKTAESTSDDSTLFYRNINLYYLPYKVLNPTDYSRKLSNVKDNVVSVASNNAWNDAPWANLNVSTTGVFINTRYSWNYCVQEYIVVASGVKWTRITNASNGSIYRDWTTDNTLPPLKILALGDSICAGYRNSGKGFVGDLGLPYKNIGVSGASISNKVTSVTNIPDQLAAENTYAPDIIIADGGINDYTHGAPLGTVPNAPAKNDTEASALDRNTVAGATGYLFYLMIKKYPKAQRFFVIVHKMYYPAGDMYYPTYSNGAYTQQDLHDLLVKMCNLYNVKVVDVYNDGIINTLYPAYVSDVDYDTDTSVTYTEYVNSDGIHPLDLGYREGYVPLIRQAIGIGTIK